MSSRTPPPSRIQALAPGSASERAASTNQTETKSKPATKPAPRIRGASFPKGSPKGARSKPSDHSQTSDLPTGPPRGRAPLSQRFTADKETPASGAGAGRAQIDDEQKKAQLAELGLGPKTSMPLRRRLAWAGLIVVCSAIAAVIALMVFGPEESTPETSSQNRAPMPGETFAEGLEPVLAPAPEVQDWVAFADTEVPMVEIEAYGGSLAVPDSSLSGLYTGLAEPGAERGATMIAAHVDTDDGEPAAFWPLHTVEEGEVITVHRNGEDHEYVIESLEIHEQDALPVEFFDTSGEHRLYLMTCAGEAVDTDGPWRYKYNLVVEATPVSS